MHYNISVIRSFLKRLKVLTETYLLRKQMTSSTIFVSLVSISPIIVKNQLSETDLCLRPQGIEVLLVGRKSPSIRQAFK